MSAQGAPAPRPEAVAVIIPAKDEAARIEKTVLAAASLDRVDVVVVVDDGSIDATSALAKGAGAIVVRHKHNRGKAAAMATGAKVIHMREEADQAARAAEVGSATRSGESTGESTDESTGESTDAAEVPPRALLFIDADMQASAAQAAPLISAVLDDGVDMAIAVLPPQEGAAGMGLVVNTARKGIAKATGFAATQPLSGTRCITRETWDAVQPLAHGWGVETGLTIDALHQGLWVKEVPANLEHRATGKDLQGQLHRAAQLRDVIRALVARRKISPNDPLKEGPEDAVGIEDPQVPPASQR